MARHSGLHIIPSSHPIQRDLHGRPAAQTGGQIGGDARRGQSSSDHEP